MALTIDFASERPCPTKTRPSNPKSGAAPTSDGSISFLTESKAGLAKSAPNFVRVLRISSSLRVSNRSLPKASLDFISTFPVNPSVTATSTLPPKNSLPSIFPMNPGTCWRINGPASRTRSFPLPSSSPLESSPTVGFVRLIMILA